MCGASRYSGSEGSILCVQGATERNWATVDVVGEIAEVTGKSYAQISLNWLLRQPAVTAPILGVRTMELLEDNLGAAGWELDEAQVQRLSEASAPRTPTHTALSATPKGSREPATSRQRDAVRGTDRPYARLVAWMRTTSMSG